MHKPTDSVRIVIFDETTAQFLVLTESDDRDNWKLPGGKFNNENESPEQAAEREVIEELRLQGKSIALRYVGNLVNDDGISARYIFSATAHETRPRPTDEVAQLKWISEAGVPDGPNREHILSAVKLARSMQTKE